MKWSLVRGLAFALVATSAAANKEKAPTCTVGFQPVGIGHFYCPSGTVVTSARLVSGTEVVPVECARAVVRCVD